jgi:hypothetical protein
MRNYIASLILCFTINSYAQSIKSTQIVQKDCVKLIGSIGSYDAFAGKHLMLGIFKVSNGIGSAKFPGTDEVSFDLLISVTHYDESPDYKVFKVGPFINPKVIKKDDTGPLITLIIEDGVFNKRKTRKVIVSEAKVQVQ